LWTIKNKQRIRGAMLAYYLIGYGTVRLAVEFFRQPDAHLGFVLMSFSLGQILCAVMVVGGIATYFYLKRTSS